MVIKTDKTNETDKKDKNSEDSSTHCKVIAHYASCLHELEEVTSGYRVALIYTLCWRDNGIEPSINTASKKNALRSNLISKYLDSPGVSFLCWFLDFKYSNWGIDDSVGVECDVVGNRD